MCCKLGRVDLPPLPPPPAPLKGLLNYSHPKAVPFHDQIKAYNAAFQMTSFGAKINRFPGFQTTFSIQGQVFHRIGSLLPCKGKQPSFAQIYFIENETQQTERRTTVISGLDKMIVMELQDMLHNCNELVRQFKTAVSRKDLTITIHSVRPPTGEHPGRYNAPTTNEVAAIVVDQDAKQRDIIIRRRDNELQRIAETHRSYDSFQYPLVHPDGSDGYSLGLKLKPAPPRPKRVKSRVNNPIQETNVDVVMDETEVEDTAINEETEQAPVMKQAVVHKLDHLTSRMYYAY